MNSICNPSAYWPQHFPIRYFLSRKAKTENDNLETCKKGEINLRREEDKGQDTRSSELGCDAVGPLVGPAASQQPLNRASN
jgi:hypothetical protein